MRHAPPGSLSPASSSGRTAVQSNTIAAPSVTIAVRQPAKDVLRYIVTITTFKRVQSYPCRSLASALKLAERVISNLVSPNQSAAAQ